MSTTATDEQWHCPNCGDRRQGGDAEYTWCLNGDCARKTPRNPDGI